MPNVGTTDSVDADVPAIERIPLTVKVAVVIVLDPVPPMITLLKTEAPVPVVVIVCAVPLNATVPVPATKPAVPREFVQFPLTVKVTAPERVTEVVDPIVMLLHTAAAEIVGPVTPFGIFTLVIASGTDPQDQLSALFQLVSEAPVHSPGVHGVAERFKTPVEVERK